MSVSPVTVYANETFQILCIVGLLCSTLHFHAADCFYSEINEFHQNSQLVFFNPNLFIILTMKI